jgi:hypothetical protein
MARDDTFKKVQEAGADFLETARARAEEFLRELSRAGGGTSGSLNELFKESRKGTEQLVATIRKEVRTQLSSLGLATKTDLARLERKVAPKKAGTPAKKAPARKTTASKKTASKSTGTRKSTTAGKSTATRKAAPRKAAAKKTAG